MNVSFSDEQANFVEAKVGTGRYRSSSDVVREALRLMESLERGEVAKLGWLRIAWREGVDSGDAGELDLDDLKREARELLAA